MKVSSKVKAIYTACKSAVNVHNDPAETQLRPVFEDSSHIYTYCPICGVLLQEPIYSIDFVCPNCMILIPITHQMNRG